jgi:cytochrome c oxidase accessory protein FixG
MSEENKMTSGGIDYDPSRVQNIESGKSNTLDHIGVEILPIRVGGSTVHAKRMGGLFRNIKTIIAPIWLLLFLGPYLRWEGHQAILWDIPNRQFHILGLTILPQDIWMLALILLFFAMALAAASAVAGRLWCGYFCFQTVWMDAFTWIEEKIIGNPNKQMALDKAPWNWEKIKLKGITHLIFLTIGMLTGLSFVAFFTDALALWHGLLTGTASSTAVTVIVILGFSTYFFAAILREQTCVGVCPYARIQGAMLDKQTLVPTYDIDRGEPRGRMKRARPGEEAPKLGDCIDCNLCVAVCPTGIDIRNGQQLGCITCGLCIDACDSVMEKLDKPLGLIRYASLEEFEGKIQPPLFKRPRVIVYGGIMAFAGAVLVYGLATIAPLKLNVLHERAPLFVMLSDGSIQNKLIIKVVNKTDKEMVVKLSADGIDGMRVEGDVDLLHVEPGNVGSTSMLVKVPRDSLKGDNTPLAIHAQDTTHPDIHADYESMFIGPK